MRTTSDIVQKLWSLCHVLRDEGITYHQYVTELTWLLFLKMAKAPLLEDLGAIDLRGIDWVIVGGESGPGARPMAKEWVLSICDQCRAQKVPFFFKQWGGVQKAKHGRLLEGRTYDGFPKHARRMAPQQVSRRASLPVFDSVAEEA